VTRRDRLGRGLGALLGDYMDVATAPGAVPVNARMLPVAAIVPNPFQPRREFSEAELDELSASMRQNGLLQPIVVRPARGGASGRWELVAGERRWRASKRLGWHEIAATVRDVDDRTMLVLALVENVQRAGLSPLEEAEAFQRLGEEFALSHQEIAALVGRDRSTVSNALRLLQLPASVRGLLAAGRLTAGHARALLGLASERMMADLAREAADAGWSVREVELRVQRARPGARRSKPAGRATRDAAERLLEEELQRVFGTAVHVRSGRGMKGRIEIPFYGAEDFERIFELLVGRAAADVVS
jgi:ParB family transcriptional regulator, chromosome partitioning protein